ncbi:MULTISPECIES: hypothetical protein [unclassified Aeromicrobium]|uniref:hypothetical protein n=1 Tax=unclassified Aeromicrobium TaxID=2633570 RepID=UPI00396B245F
MSDAERVLFAPLQSNAHTLLAGRPVVALTARLKQASITFDRVLLEGGAKMITAGPELSAVSDIPSDGLGFQTPSQRRIAVGQSFSLTMGPSGQGAESPVTFGSKTSIRWQPTLEPLRPQLGGVDWVEFVYTDMSSEAKNTARKWARLDRANGALKRRFPDELVRGVVIKHATSDLALAAHAGVAVMQDSLHQEVARQRMAAESGWRPVGFAVPMIVPQVSAWSWAEIAELRKTKHMKNFQRVLAEFEACALDEARNGDVEAAVHRAKDRYLAAAVGEIEGLGTLPKMAVVEFGVGTVLGAVTSGVSGPMGIVAGAALGTVVATVHGGLQATRARRLKGWVSVYNELLV